MSTRAPNWEKVINALVTIDAAEAWLLDLAQRRKLPIHGVHLSLGATTGIWISVYASKPCFKQENCRALRSAYADSFKNFDKMLADATAYLNNKKK